MACHGGPNIAVLMAEDNLVCYLDAGNTQSYPGTGDTWIDLSNIGPITEWPSGNVLIGNSGALQGSPTFSNGAIVFDGTDDYISMPLIGVMTGSIVLGTADFTMECWAYADVSGGDRTLISTVFATDTDSTESGSYELGLSSGSNSNKIRFTVRNDAGNANFQILSSSSISTGTWFYSVVTRTGGDYKMYFNGELETTGSDGDGGSDLFRFVLRFGVDRDDEDYWNGGIGIIKIYKGRVLTAAEVKQNYNALKGRFGL